MSTASNFGTVTGLTIVPHHKSFALGALGPHPEIPRWRCGMARRQPRHCCRSCQCLFRCPASGRGPAQSNLCCALQIMLHRTAHYSQYDRKLMGTGPASGKSQHLSQLSHVQPSLCRHQNVLVHHELSMPKVADPGGNVQCRKLAGL